MTQEKNIKKLVLRHGKIKELAQICGVSTKTVSNALSYKTDSDTGYLIRRKAIENGFVKQF